MDKYAWHVWFNPLREKELTRRQRRLQKLCCQSDTISTFSSGSVSFVLILCTNVHCLYCLLSIVCQLAPLVICFSCSLTRTVFVLPMEIGSRSAMSSRISRAADSFSRQWSSSRVGVGIVGARVYVFLLEQDLFLVCCNIWIFWQLGPTGRKTKKKGKTTEKLLWLEFIFHPSFREENQNRTVN